MLGEITVSEHGALPIHIPVLERGRIVTGIHPEGLELLGIQHLDLMGHLLDGILSVVEDARCPFGAGIGGDEHDAVTGFRPIDGGRSGVFQDFDGLDVLRIQVADITHLQSVHQIERAGRAGIRGITAYAEMGGLTRSAGQLQHLHAGHFALDGLADIVGRLVLDVVRRDRSDGASDVALALHTVTHDHHFVQQLGIKLEDDPHRRARRSRNRCGNKADTADGQRFGSGGLDGEIAIQPRNLAAGGSFHHHGCSDERFSARVHDDAFDHSRLRPSREGKQQDGQQRSRKPDDSHSIVVHKFVIGCVYSP